MLFVHGSCFALNLFRGIVQELSKDLHLLPQLLDIACIVLYQGGVFYAQIVYVNLDKRGLEELRLAQSWIIVELITYYAQIALAILFLLYSSLVKPVKPSKLMRRSLNRRRDHDYLMLTSDIFSVLNYEGTLIMGSLGILQIENKCATGQGSYRTAILWFVAAIGAQMAISVA